MQLRRRRGDCRMECRVFGVRSAVLAHPLSAVYSLHPGMTLFSRAIVEAVLLSEGSIGSASAVARALGLPNRFSVARLLRRDGLPAVHRLAEWATVLSWAAAAEHDGVSLCWIALHSRRHPSACYRLVKNVTGLRWDEVRARGSIWVEREFLSVLGGRGRFLDRFDSDPAEAACTVHAAAITPAKHGRRPGTGRP
jgi:hypothetical protein